MVGFYATIDPPRPIYVNNEGIPQIIRLSPQSEFIDLVGKIIFWVALVAVVYAIVGLSRMHIKYLEELDESLTIEDKEEKTDDLLDKTL